jgi:hypothetical protein
MLQITTLLKIKIMDMIMDMGKNIKQNLHLTIMVKMRIVTIILAHQLHRIMQVEDINKIITTMTMAITMLLQQHLLLISKILKIINHITQVKVISSNSNNG